MMSGIILLILRLALVAALYAFLGWALWVLWQDLRRKSTPAADKQLIITLVAQEADVARSYRFTGTQILIGRDMACDLLLDDKTISARHARLSYRHTQWWVEDLHSKNGTYLNQARADEPLVVASGDRLHVGGLTFEILLGENTQK
jgi:pSer/pThr/pTyr-binding forkhead associated (FHA) protein